MPARWSSDQQIKIAIIVKVKIRRTSSDNRLAQSSAYLVRNILKSSRSTIAEEQRAVRHT